MIDPKQLLSKVDRILRIVVALISLMVIGAIVVDYGFVLDDADMRLIRKVYSIGWWVYFFSFTFQLVFHWKEIRRKALSLTIVLGIIFYITVLLSFINIPANIVWLNHLCSFLQNKYFVLSVLGIFSIIELSRGVTLFLNRKTNPALLVVLCFAFTIAFGALLLLLPRSTLPTIQLPLIDALFVSTSAVCVTGLSTVEVAHTFTIEGQIIIALLIQIGGLGIMTITSFFAIFFMDGIGLYSQFTLREMLSSNALSLMSTLLHVLGFTIVIELIGAFFIWMSIHATMGMSIQDELFFSIFHSISAFCNAGFSTLEGNLGNELLFVGHNSLYLIISVLIILGGIGFPVLINLKRQLLYHSFKQFYHFCKKEDKLPRYTHLTDVNTKIVLYTTAVLVVGGTLLFALLEWNNAFAGMSVGEKVVQSFFSAVVPRTAGFNSVAVSDFSRLTIVLFIVLMWIGGASQSTAGGVKVNTLALAFASMKSLVKGQQTTELFNREIANNSIRRAFVVIFGSAVIIMLFFIGLLILEPKLSSMDLLFETVSAFSTVGSSTGITASLCNASKLLLVLLMFIGRVGLITVLMSVVQGEEPRRFRLPKENIIIN